MKIMLKTSVASLFFSACLMAAPPPAKPLTWRDLVNHPERWPAEVTVKADQKFQSGKVVRRGTKVSIAEVTLKDATLVADHGFAFGAGPAECDLLEAANAQWASFTPEQRALTLPIVERDMSLWPAKVTITQDCTFGSYVIKAGSVQRLVRVRGNDAALYIPGQNELKVVDVSATDLFARARTLAAMPKADRPGRMAEILDGLMVDAGNRPVPIKAADFYVQYWSASTCPRCAVFTPKFVAHYNEVLAGKENVAFFGSSTDATMPPYFAYVKRSNQPWPILPPENKFAMMALGDLGVIEIPGIIVFDKFGNVIMSTSRMRGAPLPVAEAALAKLDSQLAPK